MTASTPPPVPPRRRKRTFWNDAATKRDLVAGGAVLAVCVVFAIVGAVVTSIRLHDAIEEGRARARAEQERRAVVLEATSERLELQLERLGVDQATVTHEQAAAIAVLRRRVATLEKTGRKTTDYY